MSWYKIAQSGFVTVYHGTSRENYLLIRMSGKLRKGSEPNLTRNPAYARAFAKQFFVDEPCVLLEFRIPAEMIDGLPTSLVITTTGDVPIKFRTSAREFDPKNSKIKMPKEIEDKTRDRGLKPGMVEYEKAKSAVLKNLERNVGAYIPSYMRGDPDFARYTR